MKPVDYISDALRTFAFVMRHPLHDSWPSKMVAMRKLLAWYATSALHRHSVVMPFVNDTELLIQRGVGGRETYFTGLHEFEDMAFLGHILRPEDTFVDVGANIGTFSVLAARVGGARTIAFEPADESRKFLQMNVAINGLNQLVDVRASAVGRTRSWVTMASSAGVTNRVRGPSTGGAEDHGAKQVPLDDLLHEGIEPTVIKVDVEGYESEVLAGAGKLLQSQSLIALILELKGHGRSYGFDESEIHARLGGLGFLPFAYRPAGRRLLRLEGRNEGSDNTLYIRAYEKALERVQHAKSFRVGSHWI